VALLAFWCALLAGVGGLAVVLRSSAPRVARLALVGAMLFAGDAFVASGPRPAPAMVGAPRVSPDGDYVGSSSCASCHPGEHATWSRTFHRTMTQRASTATVLAPLDTPLAVEDARYVITSGEGGSVWVSAGGASPERVLLTTGSHHMQGYWVAGGNGGLRMLPFVYARAEREVLARRDAFIEPPNHPQPDVRWNSNCIACHATAGEPRATDGGFDTRVAELGVACEACHGPGAAHVARHHDPFERVTQRRAGEADPTIVNPARLPADRASAVCGQCHSYAYPNDEDAFWRQGYVGAFRPGQALEPSRTLLSAEVLAGARGPKVNVPTRDLFWPDGTVRVGGREYNAMVLSACYVRGTGKTQIGCGSCHAMHASDPDDQLRRDVSMQAACGACHTMRPDHSHHAPGSPGDACVACHMSKTSYALRTAIRSHRIQVPPGEVGSAPNACNLCHLDRSRDWTYRTLARWRGESERGTDDARALPESVYGLVTRDAAERVLWADAMGDPTALAVSGAAWMVPLLEDAVAHDTYAVVRHVAARSLRAVKAAHDAPDAPRVSLAPDDLPRMRRFLYDPPMTVAE
jgi:predicted CXXCH cytochrome family protein